jgi:hypothetical protein
MLKAAIVALSPVIARSFLYSYSAVNIELQTRESSRPHKPTRYADVHQNAQMSAIDKSFGWLRRSHLKCDWCVPAAS